MLSIIASIKFVQSELLPSSQHYENKYVTNPYDLFMLEQLLSFKKIYPCRIIGVTMGPKECLESAHRNIAMGLDDFYVVCDPCFSGSDTYATSYTLYNALKFIGEADVYAFGEKSIDGETSQIPIGISCHMGLTCFTGVEKIGIHHKNRNTIRLRRVHMNRIEDVEVHYPFTICFRGFTTKEPEISLLKIKQTRNHLPILLDASLLKLDKQSCGQRGSKTKVIHISNVINKRSGKEIEGPMIKKIETLKTLISKGGI